MVLSIGLIVKNEEKYLEKCLTALKPILESIDSELIIADTGSTDNTVEIAKKFTDNVFHFEWINDFAAARNSTLERARGEWYMFIDADEILQDCADIISFFKSGEYKKYGSATYVIRSYSDTRDSEKYADNRNHRLTVRNPEVRFINPVHEALSVIITPCKNLELIADHYGYAYYDAGEVNELGRKKTSRNLEILMRELETDKSSGKVRDALYDQIADCYHVLGEPEKALEYVNMDFENTDPHSMRMIGYYVHKFTLLQYLKRYEDLLELGKEYFSENNPAHTRTLANDCYAYFSIGMAHRRLGSNSSAIPCFLKCFELYEKYSRGELNTPDLLMCTFRMSFPVIKTCYELFYTMCVSERNYDAVNRANKLFPLSECLSDREYMLTHLMLRVEIMEHTSYSKLADLYYKLDDYNRKQLVRIMRWQFFKSDKHDAIVKKFGELVRGDQHLEDTIGIFRGFFVKKDLTPERIGEYIGKYSASENEDIWCVMMLAGYDITPYITAPDFDAERCTRAVYLNYVSGAGAAELFASYDINAVSKEGLEKAASVYGFAMFGALQNNADVSPLFEKFGQIGLHWYNEFPEAETIPGDVRAAMMVSSIAAARRNGDYKRCVSEMRDLAAACPTLAPIINAYGEMIRGEMNTAAPAVSPEFAQLAAQVKQNIRVMIDGGDLSDAESTLAELEQLCPSDPEIEKLKDEIYALKAKGVQQ